MTLIPVAEVVVVAKLPTSVVVWTRRALDDKTFVFSSLTHWRISILFQDSILDHILQAKWLWIIVKWLQKPEVKFLDEEDLTVADLVFVNASWPLIENDRR